MFWRCVELERHIGICRDHFFSLTGRQCLSAIHSVHRHVEVFDIQLRGSALKQTDTSVQSIPHNREHTNTCNDYNLMVA